jgi:hypothetical protein
MSVLAGWSEARRLHKLPDTAVAREAFYCGARFAMTECIQSQGPVELLALNDDLANFGKGTIEMRAKEGTP